MKLEIQLLNENLDIKKAQDFVNSNNCGANVIFDGVVRNSKNGIEVTHLEFEAYEPMAISELEKIAKEMFEKWPIEKIFVHHRLGKVLPGESAVIAAVCTPHRNDAFEASAYFLDRLKQTVPIWKKEFTVDGAAWVTPTP